MLITSGGLTKVLMQLEERGLVTRPAHDGDRRIKPVALTDKALRLLDKTIAELHEVVYGWFNQSLNSQEINQLGALLAKLTGTELFKQ
ncbi:transcriptional regulator SlyA [mine drainage metagenome]|uniref:Transcriptional regulator SlyA n=1 Tax=mine drainage metagenome TaxID=410659 RepID=A0A1J5Q6P2_9ZZZZ